MNVVGLNVMDNEHNILDDKECSICFKNNELVKLNGPCGHKSCKECAKILEQGGVCPFCRGKITQTFHNRIIRRVLGCIHLFLFIQNIFYYIKLLFLISSFYSPIYFVVTSFIQSTIVIVLLMSICLHFDQVFYQESLWLMSFLYIFICLLNVALYNTFFLV